MRRDGGMEIRRVLTLRGPNIWARFPVLEASLDLSALRDLPPQSMSALRTRLISLLPDIGERFGVEGRGEFASQSLDSGLAHLVGQVALVLQSLAYRPVKFVETRKALDHGLYRVAMEYAEEELARASLPEARAICLAALYGHSYDLLANLQRLEEVAEHAALGLTSGAIYEAARARGIPVLCIGSRKSIGKVLQLGHGAQQRRLLYSRTDRTSAVGEALSQDKELTKSLLQSIGIPVPEGRPADGAQDAWSAACELGLPVVVKPKDADYGKGVALNLTCREAVLAAHAAATSYSPSGGVLVERYARGFEHRLLVINDRVVAASRRDPPQVVGDGHSTISQLIEQLNQARRADTSPSLRPREVEVDSVVVGVLAEQGYALDSTPPDRTRVLLRRNAHRSTGGTTTDVTEHVHPDVAAHAVEATRLMGLDIAGLDIIASDIGRPLKDQGGVVLEINAGPSIQMHLTPTVGTPRPIAEMIVECVYPPGETGRIPIAAVTGCRGATHAASLIARILGGAGRCVGLASARGVCVGRRQLDVPPRGVLGIRAVLRHPFVDAAVLEVDQRDVLQEGLEFDSCNVAVITNHRNEEKAVGSQGVESADDLHRAIQVVVEAVAADGVVVLPATDVRAENFAASCPGSVLYYATDERHEAVIAHRHRAGRVVFVRNGHLILARGHEERDLLSLDRVFQVSADQLGLREMDLLAAVAAVWALQIPEEVIRNMIESAHDDVA
jgi:cyanophycin synthetase